MKVAKASFSQMPSHQPMVTRSPNHMCASSWAMTSATRSSSARAASSCVDQEGGVAERDAAQVLHRTGGEVRNGDQVDLVAGVGDVEVLREEAQRERADLQRELRQRELAGGADHPERHAVHVDGLGHFELADHERHQVRRHLHGRGEPDALLVVDLVDRDDGEFEMASRSGSTISVISKTALRSGSSKQGKDRRASTDSNWVVAMVWVSPSGPV